MSRHNRLRREKNAHKRVVLPLEEQRKRAAANAAAHAAAYPDPPVYDQLLDVRSDPTTRGTPQPVFIVPRFKSGALWFTPPVQCR